MTTTEGAFANAAGTRRYQLHVPSTAATEPRPLVVMLHGCTQDAADLARGTGMNKAAAQRGWMVLYPVQPVSAHPRRCWNWYEPAHQLRDAGEPAILAGMVDDVVRTHGADRARVYLVGVSAGAAMASQLAAAYPDLFAALALHSGLAYNAAANVVDGLAAMQRGVGDVAASARAAYDAMGPRRRVMPTLVIHGAKDGVVVAKNGEQAAEQWARTNWMSRLGPDAAFTPLVTTEAATGWHGTTWPPDVAVELRVVEHLGHAWSGGSPAGTFTDERAPHATDWIVAFLAGYPRQR